MPQNNALAGTARIAIDGVSYSLVSDAEYENGLVSRETLSGMDGVHGFKAKPKPGRIRATLRDGQNVSVAQLAAIENSTITIQQINGKLIVGRNMWAVEDQIVKLEDGTIEVKFEGRDGCVTEN